MTWSPPYAPVREGADLRLVDDDYVAAEHVDDATGLFQVPGFVERSLALVSFFVLAHGLPVGWFRTRADWEAEVGNIRMVIIQLILMSLGVARVAGSFNWLLRVIRVDATVFVLTALALASATWSSDPGESLRQAIIMTVITSFAAYLVLRFDLGEILELWAIAFSFSAALNLYFVLRLPHFGIYGDAWSGVYNNKNALGFAALVAVPVLMAAARNGSPLRWLFYTAAATFVILLLGSQSKTMLLGSIGTLGIGLISSWFRGRRTLRGMVYLCLLTALALTVTLTFRNLEVVTAFIDKDVSFTGRVPLWQGLIPIALDRPITGYGYEAVFTGYFSPIHEIWVVENWNPSHAHNELLNIWLQLGIAGVVTYVVMMTRAVRRAVLVIASVPGSVSKWPLMYLVSTLLISITEAGMTDAPYGWLMLAVAILAAGDYYKSEVATGQDNWDDAGTPMTAGDRP